MRPGFRAHCYFRHGSGASRGYGAGKVQREVVTVANEQNLIPASERSKSEARENGRKGGIASGAARRRKKSMREAADLFLSLPVSDKRTQSRFSCLGIEADDMDNQMAVIVGLTGAASAGDARAAKILIELLGEDKAVGTPTETGDDPITAALKEDAENGLL